MRLIGTALFAAFFVLGAASCASTVRYVPRSPLPPGCETAPADLTVLSYNAGVAPGIVRLATPRTPYVAEAIAAADADIMCIQEAWTEPSVAAIREALDLSDDRFYHVDTRGENESGDSCDPDDMSGIAQCAVRECAGVPDEDFTVCALDKCKSHGIGLYLFHRSCLNCLVSSVGHGIDDIWRRCTREGGSSRVYDGGNGVILASRWPLRDREVLRLPSSGANRVALFATVDIPGKGPVELACSHLSSNAPTSPTHPNFSSWEDEKRTQFMMISQRLRRRAAERPQLFLGDMNFGPALGETVDDASGQTWLRALREGFTSPMVDVVPPLCTSCAGNTLRTSDSSYLIDHVLVRDAGSAMRLEPVCAKCAFDDTVELRAYGRTVRTHRSDHYGALVRLRVRAPPP